MHGLAKRNELSWAKVGIPIRMVDFFKGEEELSANFLGRHGGDIFRS